MTSLITPHWVGLIEPHDPSIFAFSNQGPVSAIAADVGFRDAPIEAFEETIGGFLLQSAEGFAVRIRSLGSTARQNLALARATTTAESMRTISLSCAMEHLHASIVLDREGASVKRHICCYHATIKI